MIAKLDGELWQYNLAKVVVLDVTDDYKFMQPPLPAGFYPVLAEKWVLRSSLNTRKVTGDWIDGFLYDWHERPEKEDGDWYVGVVQEAMLDEMFGSNKD